MTKIIRYFSRKFDLEKEHSGDAGFDLRYHSKDGKSITIKQNHTKLVPTGIYLELSDSFEAQIRSRSGLALRHGIIVANSPGTIDSNYRGEVKIILSKITPGEFVVHDGDRIAQMVLCRLPDVHLEKIGVERINRTRDENGFGSTGLE